MRTQTRAMYRGGLNCHREVTSDIEQTENRKVEREDPEGRECELSHVNVYATHRAANL